MSRPRPPGLQRHKTRHGGFNWYVQVGHGPLIRLRQDYATQAFWDEYNDALARAPSRPAPKIRAAKGTLEWAWLNYKASNAWKVLSDATKGQRDNIMLNILKEVGSVQVTRINNASMRDAVDRRADTPFAARNMIQTMRGLFQWLVDTRRVSADPTAGIKVKKTRTKGFPEWNYEEILQYERHWPLGTRQRVMLDVYCYTGLRRGDAARVGPGHVRTTIENGETIEVITLATEKSQGETLVHLPMLPVLKRTLEAGPTGKLSFICKTDGTPYAKESLGNAFKDACVDAGIMDKSAHGLRKAAATRAAENGATVHQLMAIFGWTDIHVAQLYTRAADRRRLAGEAMSKLGT